MNCPNCGHLLQGETPPALDAGKTKLAITMLERFRDGRLMTAQDTHESLLGPRDQLLQEADWFDHAANVLKRSLPLQQETFPPTGPVGNTSPVDTATGGKPVGGDAAKAEPTPTLTCLECGLILPGLHQPWCSKARTQNGLCSQEDVRA